MNDGLLKRPLHVAGEPAGLVKVEGLAMLNARKQTRSYTEQLDALVTPKEQEGAQRLTGWHASQMAVNVPQRAEDKESSKTEKAAPSKVPSRKEPQPKPAPRSGGPIGSSEAEGKRDDLAKPQQWGHGGGGSQNPAAPAPPPGTAPLPAFVVDASLTACVESELTQWGLKGALGTSVMLKVRKRDGVLQVRLGVGLATPACVTAWVERHQVTTEWQSLSVPLQ